MPDAAKNTDIPAPYESWEQLSEDVERHIPRSAKVIIADIVMTWARVDSTIAQLSGASFALDPTAAAIIFKRSSVSDKLEKVRQLNLQLGRNDNAQAIRKLKKQYDERSKVRNLIAHAHCAGVLKKKPLRLVFTPFEAHGGFGNLAIEIVPLLALEESIDWGRQLDRNIWKMLREYQPPDGDC